MHSGCGGGEAAEYASAARMCERKQLGVTTEITSWWSLEVKVAT